MTNKLSRAHVDNLLISTLRTLTGPPITATTTSTTPAMISTTCVLTGTPTTAVILVLVSRYSVPAVVSTYPRPTLDQHRARARAANDLARLFRRMFAALGELFQLQFTLTLIVLHMGKTPQLACRLTLGGEKQRRINPQDPRLDVLGRGNMHGTPLMQVTAPGKQRRAWPLTSHVP